MHYIINISGSCFCTFNSAENGVFSLCENTDNQYCFSCAKVTAFTGKERDSETGFSYFGARYYDSDLSGLFLSVDPMSDKYPSLSPYAYCAWNPLKLVDPSGMYVEDPPSSLLYTIQEGDNFGNLENKWNLPHGTLQGINPNINPNNLQIGQEINAARMEGGMIIVCDNAPIPNGMELVTPNEEGPIGLISTASSDCFIPLKMAFEALTPTLGGDLLSSVQKAGRIITRLCSRNSTWQYGRNHSMIKWGNEFKKRGWTSRQVSNTIKSGRAIPAENKVNPENKAMRYKNKNTGKSVVIDKKTRELIHVGSKDFKYD